MGLISSQYKRVPANYYIDMKRAQLAAMDVVSKAVRLRAFDSKPRLVKATK